MRASTSSESPDLNILFLTNYYPPFAGGGYEQWCHEVAVELTHRGHHVCVLSSRPTNRVEVPKESVVQAHHLIHPEVVSGLMHTTVRLLRDRKRMEQENLSYVQKLADDFEPDVALIWGMWNVPRSVPALVEKLLPGRVAYYLCDYWPSLPNAYIQQWQEAPRRAFTKWPRHLIGRYFLSQLEKEAPISLELEHPICVSQAVRELLVQAGVPVDHAQVIYGGTQTEEFASIRASKPYSRNSNSLKLLYAGRLSVEKGIRTAIHAMSFLADRNNSQITLDIVGTGVPDHEEELRALAQGYELSRNVSFRGHVPRSEMPAVLAQYDALVFPSEWQEPFARMVLEAMAAGLVVIGTRTGGTSEILIEGKTGLTFPAGNAQALANQIQRLLDDVTLRQRLAQAGQQCVMEKFTFQRMVDEIEAALYNIAIGKAGV